MAFIVIGGKRDYKCDLDRFIRGTFQGLVETEYRFDTVRRWRFDWAIPELKLAIEYEGQAYRGGKSGHNTIAGYAKDCEKYNRAEMDGWMILRFTAKMVENGLAFQMIEEVGRK